MDVCHTRHSRTADSQLSVRLGDADWLDDTFSAGDLMMVHVLQRLKPSGILNQAADQACRLIVNWGFSTCGFTRIQACIPMSNKGSEKVLNKCGYRRRGASGRKAVDDKKSKIRERYLGNGVALGSGCGVAMGAGLGVVLDNLAPGISLGLCLGTACGIVIGSIPGNKHAKAVQESSDTDGTHSL